MLVKEICRIGYFDKVTIDGYLLPLYNNLGIEVKQEQTLVTAIEANSQAFNQGIARLRITIYGEASLEDSPVDINRMRRHREKEMRLQRCNFGLFDRYPIAYMDVFIVKSDSLLPKYLNNTGKTYNDISKVSKTDYELEMLSKALELQEKIKKEHSELDTNIAIIDRIYVNENFRRCKISTWIHNNLQELINVYGMVTIGAALIVPGDFAAESITKFGMQKEEYEKMLLKHYSTMGYKNGKNGIMTKMFVDRKKLFGIL